MVCSKKGKGLITLFQALSSREVSTAINIQKGRTTNLPTHCQNILLLKSTIFVESRHDKIGWEDKETFQKQGNDMNYSLLHIATYTIRLGSIQNRQGEQKTI